MSTYQCPDCGMLTENPKRHAEKFRAVHLLMESKKAASVDEALRSLDGEKIESLGDWPGDH